MRGRLILAHLFSKLRLLSIGTKCAQVGQRENNEPQCQHAAHSAHASQGVQYVPCVTLVRRSVPCVAGVPCARVEGGGGARQVGGVALLGRHLLGPPGDLAQRLGPAAGRVGHQRHVVALSR